MCSQVVLPVTHADCFLRTAGNCFITVHRTYSKKRTYLYYKYEIIDKSYIIFQVIANSKEFVGTPNKIDSASGQLVDMNRWLYKTQLSPIIR